MSALIRSAGGALAGAALLTLAAAAPVTGAAAQEKTLVLAMGTTPKGFDPDIWVPGQIEVTTNVYEGLVAYGRQTTPEGVTVVDSAVIEPHLAESWTVSDDQKTYVFKLREGVKSFFGNELTADDVLWTWEKSASQKRTGSFFRRVTSIDTIEKVSNYEVKFTLTQPNRLFLVAMGTHLPGIFDSVEAKTHATTDDPFAAKWLASNTASFGPWHAQSVTPGQGAVFVQNPNYAFEKPFFDQVIWREVPSPVTRAALVKSGQVQYAEEIPLQQIVELKKDPDVKVVSFPGVAMATLRMNPKYPPFDNKLVRQAVAYAIDYDAIGEAVFLGLGKRSRSVIEPPLAGAIEAYAYDTDYDKAKKLLEEAGYPDGFEAPLEYSTNFWWEEGVALQAQASLAKAGIRITPKRIPTTEMLARRAITKQTVPFLPHLANPFIPDPAYLLYLSAHSKGSSNVNANNFPELDTLIDESISETDEAKRLEKVKEAQRFLADQATFIQLFLPGSHEVFAKCIDGYEWWPHGRLVWKSLSCKG